MNFTETLCLVIAGVYALTCILLSVGVAVSWHGGLERSRSSSFALLALRLLPAVGAAFLTLMVALPAFLIHEPDHESEAVGPVLVVLALGALAAAGHGMLRGWRAFAATRALVRRCGPADRRLPGAGSPVAIVGVREPLAAVVGAWRPRIFAAECVRAACSAEEFRLVVAHEAAHIAAHDNMKLLLQIITPDVLAWMPAGTALTTRWRAAAELEADARASGSDPHERVALAAALLKVARLSSDTERRPLALSMPVAVDDVAGRVRELLAPPRTGPRLLSGRTMATWALIIALGCIPLYGVVQEFIEALVRFGQ
jgi:Zn-dependent protease with chaperone function